MMMVSFIKKWLIPAGFMDCYLSAKNRIKLQRKVERTRSAFVGYTQTLLEPCLHIGCGLNYFDGWFNTDYIPRQADIFFLDATETFPMPDASVMRVYTEHMIEHISYQKAAGMLREIHRVLKPGGRVRIATPNFDFLIELCQEKKTAVQRDYLAWCREKWPAVLQADEVFAVNNFFRDWGHQFIYRPVTLMHLLAEIGYQEIKPWPIGQSDDPQMQQREHHGAVIGEPFNTLESFAVEAIKTL